jgi:hypothetical protein
LELVGLWKSQTQFTRLRSNNPHTTTTRPALRGAGNSTTNTGNEKMIFKNKNFTSRNYECTNVVFCIADAAPDANWIATNDAIPESMSQLWITNGVRYFGWM